MSQEIEIEFKTMLTKEEFTTLHQRLPFPAQPIVQTNYYFETEDFSLKAHASALRIRKKGDQYTLTLKEPHPEGILETHDSLTEEEANEWFQNNPVTEAKVAQQLKNMNISTEDLRYYGALTTERYTFREGKVEYMLDKSFYHEAVDYELEIEASSQVEGQRALHTLLEEQRLKERKALPKIARFFERAHK